MGNTKCKAEPSATNLFFDQDSNKYPKSCSKIRTNSWNFKKNDVRAAEVIGPQRVNNFPHQEKLEVVSLKRRIQLEGARREESKRKLDAKVVVSALEERRSRQLSSVILLAESAVQKGNDIIDNLVAQGEVIRNTSEDVLRTNEGVDDIRGIMSFSKLENKASNKVGFLKTPEKRKRRSATLPGLLPSYFNERDHSLNYKLGVRRLSNVLDSMHKQHREIYGELQDQEKSMAQLRIDMDSLSGGIRQTSEIVKRKMGS